MGIFSECFVENVHICKTLHDFFLVRFLSIFRLSYKIIAHSVCTDLTFSSEYIYFVASSYIPILKGRENIVTTIQMNIQLEMPHHILSVGHLLHNKIQLHTLNTECHL